MLDFEQLWEKLINGDESTEIEAKRGEDVGKSILETISAFANEPDNGGGYFLLGVIKKENALFPDYQIVGVSDPDKVQTTLATVCRDSIQPPLRPTIWTETRDGKTVILAFIAEAQPHEKPVFIKSRGIMHGSFRRIGSTDQRCTDEDIAFLVQNRGYQSFDKTILPNTTIDDFEPRAIREYRNVRARVNPNAFELSLSDEELLDAVGATEMQNGERRATIAGILLFGKQTALRKHFPMTRVDYIRVPGREWLTDADQRLDIEMREALLLMIPRLISQILDDIPKGVFFPENSPIREDVPLVPLRAIREAVVNALMHRNYRTEKQVTVIRYSNRLEIHNPGYSLIAEEKLGEPHATQARNTLIANVLHDLNLAETKGTGIRKIREEMEKANLTLPLFASDRAHDGFTASLFTVHFFEQSDIDWLTNFKDCGLSNDESKALVYVRITGVINNAIYRELNRVNVVEASRDLLRLRDAELLETQSKGAGTFYVTGKRMWEADGITSQVSAVSLPHNDLSGKADLPHSLPHTRMPVLPKYLAEIVEKLGQRATLGEIQYAILKLCGWRALQVTELSAILNRSRRHIQERSLNPMIKNGELQYTHPENPTHPHQAYKAASKSKKEIMQDETLTEALSLIDEETPLPEGWRWARLQELCTDVSDGTHFTPEYISKGVPFLSVKDVKENGIFFNSCRYISQEQHEQLCRRCKPERGDVLYTKVGTTGVAKAIDIDTEFSIFVSVALLKLNDKVLPSYLERALNSPIGREQAENLTQGAANRNLVIRDIRTIKIPLPSTIEEQRRIAAVLDEQMKAVEQARRHVEVQLAAAKLLPNAFLRSVFESEDAQNWQKRKLGEVCSIKGGKRLPAGTDFSPTKTDFPYIRVTDFTNGTIRTTQLKYLHEETQKQISRYIISRDDVYISIAGSIGFVGTIPDELDGANLTENAARLITNKEILERDYLACYLQSAEGQSEIRNRTNFVGQPKLALERIATIEIPIPKTTSEQRKITEKLDGQMQEVEKLKKTLTEQLAAIKKMPSALLRKAFAGEI